MSGLTGFAMPERLKVEEDTASDTYARFIAEPFEKGYGHTIGNALRRVLLSSLDGVAVSTIHIDGVAHEFTTMDDIIEDVTEIVLNFKKVRLTCAGDLPRKLFLQVDKAGDVTAADIQADSVTDIINPEQHLLTVDKAREVRIEIEIDHGRGYRAAEENKREDHPIGVIPIDCLFSPVSRVAYSVHACRVGQRTDYDSLELEIWTDGRMSPQDALQQAARILVDHVSPFTGVEESGEATSSAVIQNEEDQKLLRLMLRSVGELELSVRAQNCLNNANISTLGELIQYSEADMLKFRNFGQKSLNEIKEKIEEVGLTLSHDVQESVRLAFDQEIEKLKVQNSE